MIGGKRAPSASYSGEFIQFACTAHRYAPRTKTNGKRASSPRSDAQKQQVSPASVGTGASEVQPREYGRENCEEE